MTPEQALILAVNRLGSQAAMARLCNVTQPSVWHWLNESKQLPAEYVLIVECATNVSRSDLRPDLYPRGLQDGVPFCADPLEGPLAAADDDSECDRKPELQRPAA